MAKRQFTLILAGVSEISPELADTLYEALHGDIELEMREGVAFLEVSWSAKAPRDSIASAIRAVEAAGVGVARVEP